MNKETKTPLSAEETEFLKSQNIYDWRDIMNLSLSKLINICRAYHSHLHPPATNKPCTCGLTMNVFCDNTCKPTNTIDKSIIETVEETFKGLADFIDDKEILQWYKDLIVTCIEHYKQADATIDKEALREEFCEEFMTQNKPWDEIFDWFWSKLSTPIVNNGVYNQLDDIHSMLAKLPIEKTIYEILSGKILRVKENIYVPPVNEEVERLKVENGKYRKVNIEIRLLLENELELRSAAESELSSLKEQNTDLIAKYNSMQDNLATSMNDCFKRNTEISELKQQLDKGFDLLLRLKEVLNNEEFIIEIEEYLLTNNNKL